MATRPHGHMATPGHPATRQPATCFLCFWWNYCNCFELLNFFEQLATRSCMVPGAMLFSFPGSFATCSWCYALNLFKQLATHSSCYSLNFSGDWQHTLDPTLSTFSCNLQHALGANPFGPSIPNFSSNLQALGATRLTISSSMAHALDATPSMFSSNHATRSWCYFSHALNLMVVVDFDMEHV